MVISALLSDLLDRLEKGTITDRERQQLIRSLRNIVDAPNTTAGERSGAALLLAAQEARQANG